ncbi:unnamed protein product [Macrosiphum euphorbiae]|uniref:Transferrin-like domain-containing protein n=1 Tax=Macrosiphum euphorbiae TaxID=13131 RepID=A0AAV0W7Z7_9HEMI|nr:unnamed protein product [Macrosiphum euphorbiae]
MFPPQKHTMKTSNNYLTFLAVCLVSANIAFVHGDISDLQNDKMNCITWCTLNVQEQSKCLNLSAAIDRDRQRFEPQDFMELVCKPGLNKDDCMMKLENNAADILSLDAGEVYVGGRYNGLIPLMQQIFEDGSTEYYSVALIKKNTLEDVYNLGDLKGKKACFAGVGTQAGWNVPINTLISKGYMKIVDCNNHVKTTVEFFGHSCAVNSLSAKYNLMGDNSARLCTLCASKVSGQKCTSNDPYAGDEGAFRCLIEAGDIAFLRHTTVLEMLKDPSLFSKIREDDLELLCVDGSRHSISEFNTCNWGPVPTDTIMTSSTKTSSARISYQRWLRKVIGLYGKPTSAQQFTFRAPDIYWAGESNQPQSQINNNITNSFDLFDSSAYDNHHNLLLQDSTRGLRPINGTQQTYTSYLGEAMNIIHGLRYCPVSKMTLCVTSEPEMDKCIKMKLALKVQLLVPELHCFRGYSQVYCMQAIRNGNADVAVMDAGDIYTAGLHYDEIPFITEVYDLPEPEYYVVAVAKVEDRDTEISFLKGKMTCHPSLYSGGGWIIPMAFLMNKGWIRSYGCDSIKAASEYFSKSCVPGALSNEFNSGLPYYNLCQLCRGSTYRYCKRDSTEDFYGYTGALRCLVEGGGNVAFVKHTTVYENVGGRRKQLWARNTLTDDFELLCPDGRSSVHDYERCSLGRVKANAVITRGGEAYNHTEVIAFTNLLMAAQQWYGRKSVDKFTFSMFESPEPYSDLIFQDATQHLLSIDSSIRHYSEWLGENFMLARRLVDCRAPGSNL